MYKLRRFETEAEYSAATLNYPSVSWVVSGDTVHYDKTAPVTPKKFQATYSGGQIYSLECDSNTTLSSDNTKPSDYEYTAMTDAVVGDCVTIIGDRAFSGCSSLTSITIPDSVTSIGNWVFQGCSGLTSVTVNALMPPTLGFWVFDRTNNCPIYVPAESVNAYKTASGWNNYASRIQAIPSPTPIFNGKWLATYIGGTTSSAECDSTSAITENEITKTNLESVEIGDCVTSIGNSAFSNYGSLTSIDIPSGVTSIGVSAFYFCYGLTSAIINGGSIGDEAFRECTSLTSCTIGSGVTSIGQFTFMYCSHLASVTINATTPPTLGSRVFENTNDCPIYVPAESVDAYKAANNWSTYADRIQPIQ